MNDIDAQIEAVNAEIARRMGGMQQASQNVTDVDSQLAEIDAELERRKGPGFLQSIGQGALEAVGEVGKFVDTYSGAPTRAALGQLVTGQGVSNAASAFGEQFGEDPSKAPTGKDVYLNAGLPEFSIIDDPTKEIDDSLRAQGFSVPVEESAGITGSGALGFVVDVLADPTNYIPVGAVAKGIGKGISKGAKAVGRGTLAAVETTKGGRVVLSVADDTAKALDNVLTSIKKSFNPSQADDFADISNLAKKHGIDPSILPETVEFGPSSTIAKKAKYIAEGPAGEATQLRFRKAQNEVARALDDKIKTMGGGSVLSDAEAGNLLTESYNNAIKNFFDQDFTTNAKIIGDNPGLMLSENASKSFQSKLNGIEKFAKGRTTRGFGAQNAQAKQLLKDIDALRNSITKDGGISYKQASEALSNLGEEAFKKIPEGIERIPVDRKKLQEMYFSLRESMSNTVADKVSPEIATELANSNAIISDFLTEKGAINKLFSKNVAPEKIAKSLIDNTDTKRIQAIQNIFSMSGDTEALKQFKGFVADKLIKKGKNGNPLYTTTINNLGKNRDIIEAVFSPSEISDLGDILKIGDRVGDFVLNPSGTNVASRFSPTEFIKNLGASATDEVTLERLKSIARGKIKPSAASVPTPTGSIKITKEQAKATLPLFTKKLDKFKLKEAAKTYSIQQTNKEREKERDRRRKALQE